MHTEEFYRRFSSNTLAGTSNQYYADRPETVTACAFYRVFRAGTYPYSFLFTNTTDSTFADGRVSRRNEPGGEWEISGMEVALTPARALFPEEDPARYIPLTFSGAHTRRVLPDELFCTDPIPLTVGEGDYLCLRMTYRGRRIPCHVENQIPTFLRGPSGWRPEKEILLPSMVGAERKVRERIGFFGDSITQGIGCPEDSYAFYAAVCAKELGTDYSFWNLGIGYARASDAATGGAWLQKALHCDTLIVCLGVNDILHIGNGENLRKDLMTVAKTLTGAGKKVFWQFVPPFDYDAAHGAMADEANELIATKIQALGIPVFDETGILTDPAVPYHARYGGHPDAEGCALWGRALAKFLRERGY